MTGPALIVLMKKLTVMWAFITAAVVAQDIMRPATVAVPVLDPVIITLIGGMIVTVISAIVTGIVTVITALRQTESNKKIDGVSARQIENTASIVTMAKDTEAIKGHVNSEKTAAEGREVTLRKENELLREMIAAEKHAAALLAQAAASRIRVEPLALSAPQATVEKSLLKIEDNTAAIEQNTSNTAAIEANTAAIKTNTARTDAIGQDVQDLKDKA